MDLWELGVALPARADPHAWRRKRAAARTTGRAPDSETGEIGRKKLTRAKLADASVLATTNTEAPK